jgi:acylphosphatase
MTGAKTEVRRAQLIVSGRVQGVFFRASARDEARRLGLAGEIRNLPDGSVEAIAEGNREALDTFIAWCRAGPPMAEVEEVDIRWLPATNAFDSFRIVR